MRSKKAKAKKVVINVTNEDLKKGKIRDPLFCPVALAARREGIENASVGLYYLTILDQPRSYLLPDEVVKFIAAYDRGEKVAPFSFELA